MPLTSPDGRVFEVTLTIPGEVTPDELRVALKRLNNRWVYVGVAALWRAELQKRGQPHLHMIVYMPEGTFEQWRAVTATTWLACLPERCRDVPGARQHAFLAKPALMVDGALVPDEAWMRYLVGHQSKRKVSQLGWKGRQWGRINQKLFRPLPAEVVDFYESEYPKLNRLMRRYLRNYVERKKWRFIRHGNHGWSRVMNPAVVRRMCLWLLRERHRKDDRGERGSYLTRPRLVASVRRGDPSSVTPTPEPVGWLPLPEGSPGGSPEDCPGDPFAALRAAGAEWRLKELGEMGLGGLGGW